MIRIEHDFLNDDESDELVNYYINNPQEPILYARPNIDNYYSSQLSLLGKHDQFLFAKRLTWPYEKFTRLNIQNISENQPVLEENHRHVQKYSIVIFLNDDFEGGELVFDNITIKPVKNMLISFSKELGHHVKKVTGGERYTLVGFSDLEINIDKYAKKILI